MLAASDDDSAMQHVQAAASETSKTSETSVPAVRPLRSALLADPAALMCRPFPPLQSWGCIPCPAAGREQMPLSSERFLPRNTGMPSAPALRTTALQTAGPRKSVSAGPAAATAVLSPANVTPCPPPEPCREDCCSPSGNSDPRRIIDLLCQILDNRRC